jgi:hypothetical protein
MQNRKNHKTTRQEYLKKNQDYTRYEQYNMYIMLGIVSEGLVGVQRIQFDNIFKQ